MNRRPKPLLRLRGLFRKGKLEAEMEAEMRSHLEMRTRANLEAGMNAAEARLAARRQFGRTESIKQELRDQRGVRWLEDLVQDLRFGARMLRKNPGFTATAVLSLALGIGLNSMMFSFFNAYLLRPVPLVRDPGRMVEIDRTDTLARRSAFSLSEYEGFREHNDVLSSLVAQTGPRAGTLVLDAGPAKGGMDGASGPRSEIRAKFVSDNYFSGLGVGAALGRTFLPEDGRARGSAPVVVLSHGLWNRRFGGDPDLIGKTLTLDNRLLTVVGVAPEGFSGLGDQMLATDAWLPLGLLGEVEGRADGRIERTEFRFQLAGRLKPGVSRQQAENTLKVIDARVAEPDAEPRERLRLRFRFGCTLMPPAENLEMVPPIMTAMGLVLLIACANVATLLLARVAGRQKEIGVRLALGAGRGRVARLLLTESALISGVGGVCGLLLGWRLGALVWSMRGSFLPPDIPLVDLDFSPDWRVCGYALVLSLLGALFFGLAPALEASRFGLWSMLKNDQPKAGRWIPRPRQFFAAAQIALCLSLLTGAGLLLRAVQKAAAVEFGYETKSVVRARFDLRRHGYGQARAAEFQRQLLERAGALPGVKSASLALHTLAGREHVDTVSREYFKTMRIPIERGRAFTEADARGGAPVAVVSRAAAARLWPGQDPIGRRMTNAPFAEIIGIAGNARNLYEGLVANARPSALLPNAAFDDYLYLPLSTGNPALPDMQILARTDGDPTALISMLRHEARKLDPTLFISAGPLTQELDGAFKLFRGLAGLADAIGLTALFLAMIGIYGVMAYAVNERVREIGIRLALGAQKVEVFRWILGKGGRLTLYGLALGAPGGAALSVYLSSLLVGLRPVEPPTFLFVCALLGAAALLACYPPARRATSVDPMTVLRAE